MFFDTSSLGFLVELKRHWLVVRDELDAIEDKRFDTWPVRHLFNGDWKTLVLFDGYNQRSPRRIE